jgi:hypothetical protein
MRKLKFPLTLLAVGSLAFSANAIAEDSLQQILDNITVAPVAGDSSVDVTTDALSDSADSIWSITGSGGSVSSFIIEIAGFAGANTFGIYDSTNSANMVELFDGAATEGYQSTVSIKLDGSVSVVATDQSGNFVSATNTAAGFFAGNSFGYYLESNGGPTTWYSDSALNSGGGDQMLAFQGKNVDTIQIGNFAQGLWTDNEYILAWEDIALASSDKDYNDMVLLVESVTPVPLPAAAWLFGSALLGMAGVGWRRRS